MAPTPAHVSLTLPSVTWMLLPCDHQRPPGAATQGNRIPRDETRLSVVPGVPATSFSPGWAFSGSACKTPFSTFKACFKCGFLREVFPDCSSWGECGACFLHVREQGFLLLQFADSVHPRFCMCPVGVLVFSLTLHPPNQTAEKLQQTARGP